MVSGMVPVMLPITARPAGHLAVGVVVASFFLGQLAAPYAGSIADRFNRQREIFLASFPVMAICSVVLGVSDSIAVWVVAALIAGAAAGTTQTLGSVFIVEGHPKSQWNTLLGWFRLTFGLGQVIGLAIGSLFADSNLRLGWIVAAVIIFLGVFLGRIGLPHLSSAHAQNLEAKERKTIAAQIQGLASVLRSRFGIFLACWFLSMLAMLMVLNAMPLVMSDGFGIGSSQSATVYLVGALIGALLYPAAGSISGKLGPGRVAFVGLTLVFVALVVMAIAFFAHASWSATVGLIGLFFIAVPYPFSYIGANMLAATLSSGSEGSAMGLFNATAGSGAVVGALAPIGLASAFGYGSYLPLAATLAVFGILVGLPVLLGTHHRQSSS